VYKIACVLSWLSELVYLNNNLVTKTAYRQQLSVKFEQQQAVE